MARKGGLAFLNKKGFHTQSIKNIEIVWAAEEKAKAEERRMQALAKEREEERQIEDLRRLQANSGLISKSGKGRLDWMYSAPMYDQNQAEEHLLGKEAKMPGETNTVKELESKQAAGSLFLDKKVSDVLEMENRLREDPMMVILREEQSARGLVLKNPLKMKRIRENADLIRKIKKASEKALKKAKKSKANDSKKKSSATSDDSSESASSNEDGSEAGSKASFPGNKYRLLHPSRVSEDVPPRSRWRLLLPPLDVGALKSSRHLCVPKPPRCLNSLKRNV
jgi:hypothetical protein